VAWLAASLEGLDHEHTSATAGTRLCEWLRRRRIDFDRRFGRRRCQFQEFTCLRDPLGAFRAGKQTVVADAVEAFGQRVDEEAADGRRRCAVRLAVAA
jgi:hypothetical protein